MALSPQSRSRPHIYANRYIESAILYFFLCYCCTFKNCLPHGLYTVYADEFLHRPLSEFEKIVSFAGHKSNRESLLQAVELHLPALRKEWEYDIDLVFKSVADGTGSLFSTTPLPKILDLAINAVGKEMVLSQNMTKWPCKSFRDFPDKGVVKLLPLTVGSLAADCEAPHVKCSVRYDTEEHKKVKAEAA
jgi:hypothetical protein